MLEFYPAEFKKKFINAFIREVILNTSSANFYFLEELISRKEGKKEDVLSEEVKPKKLEKDEIKGIVKDYYKKSPRERVREYFRETGDKINFNIDFNKYDSAGKEIEIKKESGDKGFDNRGFVNKKFENKKLLPIKVAVPTKQRFFARPTKQFLRVPESGSGLPERFRHLGPVRTNQPIDLGKLNILLNDKNVVSIECQGAGRGIFVSGRMGKKPTNIILSNEEINQVIETFSVKSKIPVEEGLYKVAYGGLVLIATVSSSGSNFIIKKI